MECWRHIFTPWCHREKPRCPIQTTGDFTHWYQRIQTNHSLMSKLCHDCRGRNPNIRLQKAPLLRHPKWKLSDKTQGWGLTMPVNLHICNTVGHKLLWSIWLFQIYWSSWPSTKISDVSSSVSHWHCLGWKTSLLKQGCLQGRNAGLHSPHC